MWRYCVALLAVAAVSGKYESEDIGDVDPDTDTAESGDRELTDGSSERIGVAVTQITRHPYAASLLSNGSFICSAVIVNTYWLITETKCFDSSIIVSYVTHRNLKNFTVRVGSSYNTKGGTVYKVSRLTNNFDLKVSAIKVETPMEFNSRVSAARLPAEDDEVTLGYLASIVAWTPVGHMRVVNAPIIEASICDPFTKLQQGYYICVGGVQDVNRHFCRKDNGGAVIQNNTLIGITSYLHSCAVYSRSHAFPKVAAFTRWLDSVIWDEGERPTTISPINTSKVPKPNMNVTESPNDHNRPFYNDPRKYMLSLPFDPINVPLEPAGDNSVIPRMSMYESYLQSVARARTSTTLDPKEIEEQKRNGLEKQWMQKYGNAVIMMPQQMYPGKNFHVYN